MKIEEKKVELKNGQFCILRSPKPEDAEQLIAYLKATAGESKHHCRAGKRNTTVVYRL